MRMIPCHKCRGTGNVPLPEHLAETLSKINGNTTSLELAEKIPGMTRGAQSNRLEELRALGIVERKRKGKWWIYTTVKTKTAKK
jgi:hypothetical protein